jgi:hypothetical protein
VSASATESSTPILDLLRPLPKPDQERATGRFALPFLTFSALISIAGDQYFLLVPLGLLAIALLSILVHELGHVVAGWCMGLRFKAARIGPASLRIDCGQWKFRIHPRLFHGYTLLSLDRIRRVRRRLVVSLIGSPLASVVSGALAIITAEIILARSDSSGWTAFLDCYGVWSLFMGCVGALYLRDGYVTDGALLRALLFSRDEAKQLIAGYAMSTVKHDRLFPPDYFRRWFRMASLPSRLENESYCANWLAYEKEQDVSIAAQRLERCLARSEQMDEDMRDGLVAEAAFFHAYRRNDLAKAEKWWSLLAFPSRHNRLSRIRVEAGMAYARLEFERALGEVDRGLQLLGESPETAERLRLFEEWSRWRKEITDRILAFS